MFVNRISELDLLEKHYQSGRAELFVLYGRRRVGKTELLAHFCQNKRHVFFVADQVPEQTLRANLSKAVNDLIFGAGEVRAVYNTWDDLLNTLAKQAESERLVVVLDEFPYLVAGDPSFASILQRTWDRSLKNTQIMLILNGSYIGMMEQTVLGYNAPLYGRRTAQYLLEPLEFLDAQQFFLSYSAEDRLRAYAVYGGTPAYLQTIQPERSLQSNILDGILTRRAALYDEVRFVLQQELREPRNYFAVLQAIASGNTRQNEIKQAAGLENIAPYLETLQQIRLVERIVPITESQPHKSRRGVYRLKDNFLRFWIRFLLPNHSQLERGAKEVVFEMAISPDLDAFTSTVFEQACHQYFWRNGLKGKPPFLPKQIGGWWQANEEIDIVLLAETHTMLVECKWSRRPVGVDILEQLEGKSKALLKEVNGQTVLFGLCSRSGFTDQIMELVRKRKDVILYDWKTMLDE